MHAANLNFILGTRLGLVLGLGEEKRGKGEEGRDRGGVREVNRKRKGRGEKEWRKGDCTGEKEENGEGGEKRGEDLGIGEEGRKREGSGEERSGKGRS